MERDLSFGQTMRNLLDRYVVDARSRELFPFLPQAETSEAL
jgi:hypothetical protein